MNVLYLTAEVPWPLTSGYLRHYHLLTGLAADHVVTHLSLTRRASVSTEAHEALAPFVERQQVFGGGAGSGALRRSIALRRAAGMLREAVSDELRRGSTDVVLLSGKDTFPALRAVGDIPLVVDVCDAASLRLRGELGVAPLRRRPALALRTAEIVRVERALAARTDHLLFASERDRAAVPGGTGAIVPNGIDSAYWRRDGAPGDTPLVAFSGVMAYRPNHDAAMRLAEALLPRVRANIATAGALIVGRDPLPALRAAGERDGVEVTGALPDLRPRLQEATVYCAPLRFASGIQNKLLEAMAMQLPVVTTEVAAAGLRIDGEQPPLEIADDDAGLAAAVGRLLDDPARAAALGAAGRRYVEHHFSWERAVALVDGELRAAAGRPAPAAGLAPAGARS